MELEPDYEGRAVATLIESDYNLGNRRAVLYVHGFIDYFFHPHVRDEFHRQEFDFYALELRKYGHSMLPHQMPNFCKDIREYYEEIGLAIARIRENNQEVYLLGHSTGGLIGCCYLNDGALRGEVAGLILNSPFLRFPISGMERLLFSWSSSLMSIIRPYGKFNRGLSPVYAETIHKDYYGEWAYDLEMKPVEGFPLYFSWVRAILKAQKRLQQSDILVPILLMHSDRSYTPHEYREEYHRGDTVLNVEDMRLLGPGLGRTIKRVEIEGGLHDLFLSLEPVRNTAFSEMFQWLNAENREARTEGGGAEH